MKLSVVIATRDRAGFLERALESLAAQDDPPEFEVVVADNGSSDATAEVVARHADAGRFPLRRVFVPEPNRSAARDAGSRRPAARSSSSWTTLVRTAPRRQGVEGGHGHLVQADGPIRARIHTLPEVDASDWRYFAVWLGVLGWSLQSLFEFSLLHSSSGVGSLWVAGVDGLGPPMILSITVENIDGNVMNKWRQFWYPRQVQCESYS